MSANARRGIRAMLAVHANHRAGARTTRRLLTESVFVSKTTSAGPEIREIASRFVDGTVTVGRMVHVSA